MRREETPSWDQITFSDIDGHRFRVFICDSTDPDLSTWRPATAATPASRTASATRSRRVWPTSRCHDFTNNDAGLAIVLMACDLIAWAEQLSLEGEMARAKPNGCAIASCTQPATRSSGRRICLRLQQNWQWSADLAAAFTRIGMLPVRT